MNVNIKMQLEKIRRRLMAMIRAALGALSGTADLRDAHAYGGLAMLGYGLHEVSPASAWMVCGLILFWLGVRR